GVLAVELFETDTGELLVNELAMRPHNSGHVTIEASRTSQFEQHLRAVLDLPLGATEPTCGHAVMVNLLGSALEDPRAAYPVARPPRRTRRRRPRAGGPNRAEPPPRWQGDRMTPLVGLVMGSDSDWPGMGEAAGALEEFALPFEAKVVSAHRMPTEMIAYGEQAEQRGIRVIIAGAGGAAHLPGMLASVTPLPVIGVPVPLRHLDGLDSQL